MFGYVIINQGEMKFKDYDIYHSYYCGLCKSLKEAGGMKSQLTLSYDMTFLVMLLTALYEEEPEETMRRCIAHPGKKHLERQNTMSRYGAEMNILLSYYKCLDDWEDEKKLSGYAASKILRSDVVKLEQKYPEKSRKIYEYLKELRAEEEQGKKSADEMASIFGKIMGELFAMKEDEWKNALYRLGFYLGKFIYLMDAYEDVEEDKKKGTYNPFFITSEENQWQPVYGGPDFDEKCGQMLQMMLAECAKEFELLPILWYEEILRNILYSGVWTRFESIKKMREEQQEEKDERSL